MSFPFSAAVGGVRRYIRHIILFCVAIVMVGTMVLTTYTASADSSTAIPLEYNAESRAKAKAYYAALVFCISETDGYGSDDLPVVSAVNGRWGRSDSSDTGDNFTDDFLSRMRGTERTVDCAKGNLIADAINYFASMNDSSIKPWNEWTLEDKRGLFCDVFYISDGSHSYKDECSDIFDNIFEYLNDDFAKYVFMPREGDEYDNGKHWHTRLNTFLNNRIIMGSGNNIEQPYENDEKFYVYDAIASNWCIGANNWGTKQLIAGDFIRGIRLEMDKNALKIVPKWAIVEHTSRNAEWLETEANSNGIGEKEIDCYEDNESGLNSLMNDPVDGVVVAAINTRVEYLRRDCKKAYVDFYNTQRDYRNTLIGDDLTEVQTEYIAWFDGLTEPRNWILDTNSCVDNWPDPSWPANPTEWSNITIFECKIEEYIHELLSTNPDPDSPDWTGYTIPDLPSDDYDNTSSDTRTDPCYQSAGALGWAICPIMSGLSNTLTSIYEDMVEPFLAVNPRLLGAEAKKVVDDVTVFANAVIIIFLLMVIFSQLTGVGIDNYGIKKSLPKLIVTAILVNLSFVICQVAVDLSNIVGSGANSMLSGVDVSITTCNDAEGGVSNGVGLNVPGGQQCVPADISSGSEAGMFKTMINVASVGLAGIGVGSIALGIASSGWLAGLIIPIFLLLITAVIAVLFFFVLLGVRQAGVVILAVLSPLALTCYMLPNTKRFFDKWKKAFTGLLVLYPICGLLIGGGQLAAKILISASQDYVTYFAGCLIMVVPFFFIPSLLKGSFAAMGNIGAKISGIGKSLGSRGRGRVEGAFKNSDRYKNRVDFNQKRAAERRAERTVNRLGRRTNLNRRQQARMAAANSVLDERAKRQRENEQKSDLSYRGAMDTKIGLESEESRRNLSDYNNTDFVHAKQEQGRLSHDENFQDALLYGDAGFRAAQHTKSQNARIERQAEADVGVLSLNNVLARSRAESRRDAQEIKNHMDRNAGLTQGNMGTELQGAIAAYQSARTHENMLRLKAAMSSADSRGMNKEMLASMGSLNLSAGNVEDAEILNQASMSKDVVISQFGKQMSKPNNVGENLSLDDFAGSGGNVKLSTALGDIGSSALNTANDDTLFYLRSHGSTAVGSDMLVQKALHAANDKELKQINAMFNNANLGNIKFTGAELTSLPESTVRVLAARATNNSDPEAANLKAMFDQAAQNIANSPERLNALKPDTRMAIQSVLGGNSPV
ncbi:MFS transporter [Candidatus Saccharibacteria bacterium]|nr:MFS transporter [Candidatus Saccharibacteria bacterium]